MIERTNAPRWIRMNRTNTKSKYQSRLSLGKIPSSAPNANAWAIAPGSVLELRAFNSLANGFNIKESIPPFTTQNKSHAAFGCLRFADFAGRVAFILCFCLGHAHNLAVLYGSASWRVIFFAVLTHTDCAFYCTEPAALNPAEQRCHKNKNRNVFFHVIPP